MRRLLVLVLLVSQLAGCGDDAPGDLPEGEFSICQFTYGDPEMSTQVLVGPCSIEPQRALDQDLQVAYVDENGDGTMLARAFRNAGLQRRLVTDAETAAAVRARVRELTAACEENPDGCLSR